MRRTLLIIIILFSGISLMAQFPITGKVFDEYKVPMPGVTILEEGTRNGTATGINGEFRIEVSSPKAVLIINSVGYMKQRISLKENQRTVEVLLTEATQSLDEVMVVGYGVQKKASVVGAISGISNEQLKIAAPANLTNAIAGRISGAIVRLSDGNIGGGSSIVSSDGSLADAQIFIRGKATTNSAAPLILVDGVESTFSNINPEDIEQMSVLKDASATAVYGVRGANGVILITTKRGQLGKPKVSVKTEIRMHQPLNFPTFLGAYEYAYLHNEASRNMGIRERYTQEDLESWKLGNDPYGHPDVDWRELLVKDYFMEEQSNFNLSGGTDLVKYFISGEFLYAGAPFKGRDQGTYSTEGFYKRYNLRSNFDFDISITTRLSISLNATTETKNDPNHNDSSGQRYLGSYWWDIANLTVHEFPVFNPNGTLNIGLPPSKSNVYGSLYSGGYAQRNINSFQTNITLNQKLDFILDGLSFRGMYGGVFKSGSLLSYDISPAYWNYSADTDTYKLAQAATTPKYVNSTLAPSNRNHFEFALDYNQVLNSLHKIGLMAIYIQSQSATAANLPVNYQGVSGRATYAYADKYLAEVNVGYNGSDQFKAGNRFALLPAISVGWVLTEEDFMKNVRLIDFLKIRGSYGTAGNDKIGGFRFLYEYKYNEVNSRWGAYTQYPGIYQLGVEPQNLGKGVREGSLGNDNVTWEIAKKANIGLDFTLFNTNLTGTVDVFLEKRDNILVVRQDVPTQTGLLRALLPAQNEGKVTNRGFEVTLNYNGKIKQVGYLLGLNYTYAHNNVDYIAEVEKPYPYQMQKGHPIGSNFGYTWTGKFYDFPDLENPDVPKPTYPIQAGDLMFADLNKDGKIDDYDRGVIGYPSIPEIVYGVNLGLNYKGFYTQVFFQGASNVNSSYGNILMNEFSPNVQPIHLGRWVYDPSRGLDTRATATYPSLNNNGGSQATRESSSFKLVDSQYLRLKTVELGYVFSSKSLKSIHISNLKIYLNGSNILTFNKYKPIDPEYYAGSSGAYFPQTKYFSAGLNITF